MTLQDRARAIQARIGCDYPAALDQARRERDLRAQLTTVTFHMPWKLHGASHADPWLNDYLLTNYAGVLSVLES